MVRGYVKSIRSQKCGDESYSVIVENDRTGNEIPVNRPCKIHVYPGNRVEIEPMNQDLPEVRQKFGARTWRITKVIHDY